MTKIDLSRQEKRYFLPGYNVGTLMDMLEKQNFSQRRFSGNGIVQTVYFLDDCLTKSSGVSYKARRYMSHFSESVDLRYLWGTTMLWEIKWETNQHELREKSKRVELTLREIGVLVGYHANCPMRPYLVVEYTREHYERIGVEERFRVTVDTGTRFWFFPFGETLAIEVGDKAAAEILRVELKFDAVLVASDEIQNLLRSLEAEGAMPLISKKGDGLNFVKWWHDKRHGSHSIKKE